MTIAKRVNPVAMERIPMSSKVIPTRLHLVEGHIDGIHGFSIAE
jgi:hypothetical protein